MIRILYTDPDSYIRNGIGFVLNHDPDFEAVGPFEDGQSIIDAVKKQEVNFTLLEINLPVKGFFEVVSKIKNVSPKTKIAVLTYSINRMDILKVFSLGVSGYFLKCESPAKIGYGIKYCYQGGIIIPPQAANQIDTDLMQMISKVISFNYMSISKLLSERKIEVFRLITIGNNNQEISTELKITEGTVKNHISAIMKKLNARDRIELALYHIR